MCDVLVHLVHLVVDRLHACRRSTNAIAARVPRNGHSTAWSSNAGARDCNSVPMFQQLEATLQSSGEEVQYTSRACIDCGWM